MDARNIENFKNLVAAVAKKIAQEEKFFTLKLATRLESAAKYHPHDVTIVQMANFLSKKASNQGGQFISRAELSDAYKKLYSHNTKCAELLDKELGLVEIVPSVKETKRASNEGETIEDLYSRHADSRLVNELESVFDKSATYKPYRKDVGDKAVSLVKSVLASKVGVEPVVKVVGGKDYAVICNASWETPKGPAHVLVPVETKEDKALVPTAFLNTAGFVNLTKEELQKHIYSTAGKSYKADVSQILEAIKLAKFGPESKLNDVERAVVAFKAATGTPSMLGEQVLYQEVDKNVQDVVVKSEEVGTFAEQLGSVAGSAEFIFGKKLVELGKSIVASKLKEFGHSNYQVKVANVTKDSIIYAVSSGAFGFKVPVKVENSKISYPKVVIANGNVLEFSKDGIASAVSEGDSGIAAFANGFSEMNPQQLISEVEKACYAGDLNRAEEALSAIDLIGDKVATTYAFATYMQALDGKLEKKASQKIKTIKVGGNEVCATTFLPVDKVYIDHNGEVKPKYRQNMDNTESVASGGFMNAKIISGL